MNSNFPSDCDICMSSFVEELKDFEKQFSHYYDFPANTQLSAVKNSAFEAIFERIGQDIFNASLANW